MKSSKIDKLFLFAVLVLTAIGLIMVFSASPTMALKLGDSFYFVKRHIFYVLLGFSALYYALHLDLKKLNKYALLIFIVSLALLLLVYIPGVGRKVLGASRWIDLGIFSFQPSELIKFTMILVLAKWLSQLGPKIEDFFRGFLPLLILVGIVAAIIINQPDLGTAISIAATSFIMFFVAGARLIHLSLIGGLGFLAVVALSLSSPYRLRRILAYLDPWKDPQGVGFHIIQSLLAVGSGGFLGLGLGASRQKFFYLPQQFTDFIFAILCEELGFIGALIVIGLFVLFLVQGLKIALRAKNSFDFLLVIGLVSWLVIQALMNLMVVVGLVPTTGIPLPFISYGGTSTIISLFSVGIILNVSTTKGKIK